MLFRVIHAFKNFASSLFSSLSSELYCSSFPPKGYTCDGFFVRRVLVHRSFLVVPKQKDTTTNKASSSRSRRRVFFVCVFFVFFFTKSKSVQNRECDDVDDFVVSHRDGWFCTDDDE